MVAVPGYDVAYDLIKYRRFTWESAVSLGTCFIPGGPVVRIVGKVAAKTVAKVAVKTATKYVAPAAAKVMRQAAKRVGPAAKKVVAAGKAGGRGLTKYKRELASYRARPRQPRSLQDAAVWRAAHDRRIPSRVIKKRKELRPFLRYAGFEKHQVTAKASRSAKAYGSASSTVHFYRHVHIKRLRFGYKFVARRGGFPI